MLHMCMIFITQKNGKKSSVNKLFAALPEVYSYTIQGISKHGGSYLWRAAEDYLHVHQKIHRIKSYGTFVYCQPSNGEIAHESF